MSTDHLLHRFAARIVSLSKAMGLDDEDEKLLWEYLSELPSQARETKGREVIDLLEEQGELNPVFIQGWSVSASIDPMFVKASTSLLGRFIDKPLAYADDSTLSFVCYDQDKLLADIKRNTQMDCFKLWFDRLQSVLREDGVNWNPPVSTDIEVIIRLNVSTLLPGRPLASTTGSGDE